MAKDKHQFERLRIIHEALVRGSYSGKELLDHIRRQLKHIPDRKVGVSKRTLISDIAYLREKGAPIPFRARKYTYDKPFSFSQAIDNRDSHLLYELQGILGRLQTIKGVEGILNLNLDELNLRIAERSSELVHFEKNEQLQNHDYLPQLYDFIFNKQVITIKYQDFKNEKFEFIVHPYLLKEYNGRWYLYGRDHSSREIYPFAVDRMRILPEAKSHIRYIENEDWDAENHFKDIVGVTKPPGAYPEQVRIRVYGDSADYVITKPIHPSQSYEEEEEYVDFDYEVILNYEFKSKIYALGSSVEVLLPLHLRDEFAGAVEIMGERYGVGLEEAPS